ncbi:hypothetical protein LCGC14_1048810 [marine sediment metagenome]|uniref:Uncharacterized protein n=1 Tax=marine sediment metagenome TaxID=412755 RepID=A0A0F9QVI2_9ZZZZ|nr:hypothetical protein [Candidatus Aminicenantes bacterium]
MAITVEILGWRVWYDGKKVFDSKTHTLDDLPLDGVIEFCVYRRFSDTPNDITRRFFGGHDYYFTAPHPEGEIWSSGSNTTEAGIKIRYPGARVWRGKEVPDAVMKNTAKEAVDHIWTE